MNSGENLRDIILLDSNSNAIVFCKKELVDKVFNSEYYITVKINRDGSLKSTKKCIVLSFKEKYWFNEDLISNIFLSTNMMDNYWVTMDTAIDCAFYAHFLDKVLKFKQFANHLFDLDADFKADILF